MTLGCRVVERWLAAWVDGELRGLRARLVRAHLSGCGRCRRAEREARSASGLAVEALRERAAGALDEEQAWRRLHARLAGEPPVAAWSRRGVFAAGALASALAALVAVYLSDWGIALGWREPPAELREHPDLFRDYAFFERVEIPERNVDANTQDHGSSRQRRSSG